MNIISFCLYGDAPIYNIGILENIRLAKLYYPGWQVLVFCDSATFEREANKIMLAGGWPMPVDDSMKMYARLIPINTNRYGITIFRDADSRISKRERAAVDQWLASGKKLHVMADHEHHASPIMGGMFGLRNHQLPNLNLSLDNFEYGDDELMLTTEVWSRLKNDCLIHGLERAGGIKFPIPKPSDGSFIGERIVVD